MNHRILRLLTPFLLIATLIVGFAPSQGTGPSAAVAATAYHSFLPLVAGGTTTPDPSLPPGFTEVTWARTAYSSLYTGQSNGRTVALIRRYAEPATYRDAATDTWLPINTTLVADSGSYRNSAGGFTARFSAGGSGTPLLNLGRAGEPTLALTIPGAKVPAPIVAASVITYPAALGAASLVYHSEPWGVKEEIVIGAAGAPTSYDLRIDTTGMTTDRQNDGGYLLRNTSGAALWRIPAPVGSDAKGALAPLSLAVIPDSNGMLVRLSVDTAWLADPARAFPVRLDPSFADPQYIGGESDVQQFGGGGMWDHRNRFLGYINQPDANKGITRIFTPINLSVLPVGITSSNIYAVRMVFTQYSRRSNTPLNTSVYPVLIPWDFQAINWENQPDGANLGANIAQSTLRPEDGQVHWDITSWVKDVINGTRPNYGLTMRADNETQTGRIFWSSNCGSLCPLPTDRPFVEFEIALDSGLKPFQDTWAWPNGKGLPTFEQYAKDYGVSATTNIVTETIPLGNAHALALPIGLNGSGIQANIPLTVTANLSSTGVVSGSTILIPRPISYLYEEVIVKAIYDDQFSAYYTAAMEGGLCMGMVSTVADFHTGGPKPLDYGGTGTVRSIPKESKAQEFIQTYHGRQVGSQVLNWMAGPGRMKVSDYYTHLIATISSPAWSANPEIIGILKGANCDDVEIGHALLPYKVVQLAANQARIFVYDPNYPPTSDTDDSHYITIDLLSGTWSYQLAPAVLWVGTDLFSTPLNLIKEKPVQPSSSGTDLIAVEGGHSYALGTGSTRSLFGGHNYALGSDELDNTNTGCSVAANGQVSFVREISRSIKITPLAGGNTSTFPDALFLPAGHAMAFTGVGAKAGGLGDTMVFGPHALMGYLTPANATTRDVLRTDADFHEATFSTTDPSKPLSIYQIRETDAWTRVYAVNNTTIDASAPLVLRVSQDLRSLTVVNVGHARAYDLGFGHYGSDGVGQAIYPAQPIGANERRIYTPMYWADVAHSPVLVEIDLGNDGTIDRVELIGGDVFPGVASLSAVPTTPGAELTLIDHNLEHGNFGWANLDHPLAPGQQPPPGDDDDHDAAMARHGTNDEGGDDDDDHDGVLARWLAQGGNPGLTLGGGLIGVPGKHEDLIKAVQHWSPEHQALYKVGDLMLVPLYDQISAAHDDGPVVYRIGGFALVEILGSGHDDDGDDDHDHDAQPNDDDGGGDHDDDHDDGTIHARLVARFAP